jgi:heme A synthase
MKNHKLEIAFLILVIAISIAGFWKLFIGADAKPIGVHYLHIITCLLWLVLLLIQLINIQQKRFSMHPLNA